MNKEQYLTPGTIWILEEGMSCSIKDVNACIIRFTNAAFVVYSTIHNRYAANESISMNQDAISKEAFLEMWRPEPDNDMNEIIKDDDEEEPVDKWFGKFQIWEPIIPGAEGTLVIIELNDDKVICKQLMNAGKVGECLDEKVIDFDKDKFTVAFKPTKKQYISSLGITIKDTASPKAKSAHFDMVDSAIDALKNTGDSTTNYLKMDGEKAAFESGAIRYTKTGKGRYDLIPNDVIADIIGYAQDKFYERNMICISKADIIEDAYRGEADDRFSNTIINLIIHHYAPADIVTNDMGLPAMEATIVSFMDGFANMMKDLAVHYENGAEKYGVDNWKKGIPVTGGDRGGSFMDSAMRHLTQYLVGLEDEPHYISCIWNCACGLWTLRQQQMHPDKK